MPQQTHDLPNGRRPPILSQPPYAKRMPQRIAKLATTRQPISCNPPRPKTTDGPQNTPTQPRPKAHPPHPATTKPDRPQPHTRENRPRHDPKLTAPQSGHPPGRLHGKSDRSPRNPFPDTGNRCTPTDPPPTPRQTPAIRADRQTPPQTPPNAIPNKIPAPATGSRAGTRNSTQNQEGPPKDNKPPPGVSHPATA